MPNWDGRRGTVTTRWPEPTAGGGWEVRLRISPAELQEAWGEFLGRLPWEVMVTLTFDPKKVFPVSQIRTAREALRWCTSLEWMFRRAVGWLYATERGRGGLWHAHVLVIGAKKVSWTVPVGMWEARNGMAHVQPVWEGDGAVLYATKSVQADGEVTVSDTLIRYREHVRPQVVVELFPDEGEQCGDEMRRRTKNGATHRISAGVRRAAGAGPESAEPMADVVTGAGVTQGHKLSPDRPELVLAELLGIVRRIETDFLSIADLLLEAYEGTYWVKWGYESEGEAWEEGLGLGRRTAYRLLAIGRMMRSLGLAGMEQARQRLAEVGSRKAAIIAPVVEQTGDWQTWVERARTMSRDALSEAVAVALGRHLGHSGGEPGSRFRAYLINAMPDEETRQLAEEFFTVGAKYTGSQNAVGIMIAGFQESLGTWRPHFREEK